MKLLIIKNKYPKVENCYLKFIYKIYSNKSLKKNIYSLNNSISYFYRMEYN